MNTEDAVVEIKKNLKSDKLIIGTQNTFKKLKSGDLKFIFISRNVPGDVKEDIEHYSELAGTEVVQLDKTNDELGVVCRKPFNVSVLSLKK